MGFRRSQSTSRCRPSLASQEVSVCVDERGGQLVAGKGSRLPTAQQVVASLAINPNPVLKAYRDLERAGLVLAGPGMGTFVVATLPRTDPEAQAHFRRSMAAWLRSARAAGSTSDDEAIYRTAVRDGLTEGVA